MLKNNFYTVVLNYLPLTERKSWMEQQLKEKDFSFSFFQVDYEKENHNYSPEIAKEQSLATNELYEPRPLTQGEYDLIRKHQWGIITHGHIADNLLVLEDDAEIILGNRYSLSQKIYNVPDDYDVIIAGGSFKHSEVCTFSKFFPDCWLADHPSTNTSCSILYKRSILETVVLELQSAQIPLDWMLNYIFKKHNFKVYHLFPYFFKQNKSFNSSLQ
jgi:hypothetical protein